MWNSLVLYVAELMTSLKLKLLILIGCCIKVVDIKFSMQVNTSLAF